MSKWSNGAEGLLQWASDVDLHIVDKQNKVIPFEFQDFQRETIEKALTMDDNGEFKYQTVIISFPRRHSKSLLSAIIVLWRFCTFEHQNLKVIGNTERQTFAVCFKALKDMIRFTPKLRKGIGLENIRYNTILYPKKNNQIEALISGSKHLYGESVDLAWITEMHETNDDSTYHIMSTSMGDAFNAQILLDSTVDAIDGPMHRLEQIAEENEAGIGVCKLEYQNKKEAIKKAPPWISKKWIEQREKEMLPSLFAQQILNRRSQAENHLFSEYKIRLARKNYDPGLTKDELKIQVGDRKMSFGGGLDRAKPFSVSAHTSNTIWTTILKIVGEDGEPQYHVVDQQDVFGSLGKSIKKAIQGDMDKYNLDNFVLEDANVSDIRAWAADRGYPFECLSPTNQRQEKGYMDLYYLFNENRIFIPKKLSKLYTELRHFSYQVKSNNTVVFGRRGRKDDRVYSLMWAVYALRDRELASYELDVNIKCNSKSPHAKFCYLRGSNSVIQCSETCPAHQRVKEMFNSYKKYNVESELTIPKFFAQFVEVKSVKMYNAI